MVAHFHPLFHLLCLAEISCISLLIEGKGEDGAQGGGAILCHGMRFSWWAPRDVHGVHHTWHWWYGSACHKHKKIQGVWTRSLVSAQSVTSKQVLITVLSTTSSSIPQFGAASWYQYPVEVMFKTGASQNGYQCYLCRPFLPEHRHGQVRDLSCDLQASQDSG